MTIRERFNRAMRFLSTDRLPLLYWNPWKETKQRWEEEGMKDYNEEISRFDGPMQVCSLYGRYQGPIPPFEERIIYEDDRYIDVQNYIGQVERRLKEGTSMPFFLDYPIKSRADWNSYKKRLDPDDPERYPTNWDECIYNRKTKYPDKISGLCVWGFYGFPRNMFGPEKLSLMFYDDPSLITEMNEYWVHFTMKRLERAMKELQFDCVIIWEDNCYNHGMLHSPKVFKDFMAPYYKILVNFFKRNGIDVISVDSDGNVTELIPLLLDVGVTGIHPFEVAAGMDVVKIGKEYPKLQIWGGIDKRVLAEGPKAIDAELERVILPIKKRGGYAAGPDHSIPHNVSLENFRYFVKKLSEIA